MVLLVRPFLPQPLQLLYRTKMTSPAQLYPSIQEVTTNSHF